MRLQGRGIERLLLAGVVCVRERQSKGFENEQELVSAAAARHGEAMPVLGDGKTQG